MTNHLRPDEFVDAMDGALPAARHAHLENCAECRTEMDTLLSMQAEARGDDAHEPSPLFWDHFSARVREATANDAAPEPQWRRTWRTVATLAAAAAAVVIALQMRPTPSTAPVTTTVPTTSVAEIAPEDDGSWDIVMGLASEIAWDDVRDAVTPAAGAADAAIEELTPAQREALVRLLKQEIGE